MITHNEQYLLMLKVLHSLIYCFKIYIIKLEVLDFFPTRKSIILLLLGTQDQKKKN